MIVRILVWNLFESKTTMDELRDSFPELEPPSAWIWNEANDRFRLLFRGEELPETLRWAIDIVGD